MRKIIFIILLQVLGCSACKTSRKVNEQSSFKEKQMISVQEENLRNRISNEMQVSVSQLEEGEQEQIEKITIFFDSSLPVDSFSGLPPVWAIEHSKMIKGNQKQKTEQTVATFIVEEKEIQQKETVIQTMQEEEQSRKETPALYTWLVIGGMLAIGVLVILFYCRFR